VNTVYRIDIYYREVFNFPETGPKHWWTRWWLQSIWRTRRGNLCL